MRLVLTDAVLAVLVIAGLLFHELVVYGLQQLNGQMRIVWNARPVKEVLGDATVPDSVKNKLRLIGEIRAYAFDSIGLVRNENYTSYYDLKGQPPVYVVTACRPFALQPHLWSFPVLGSVPYKGFFVRERAARETTRLRAEGWDAQLGSAGGWSTLGWFNDPVLSNMLRNDEGDLAELIIHELTHGTLFVKDSVEFNENLASFVGYKGALQFLEKKYGKDSPQMKAYLQGRADETAVETFMLRHAHQLDSLYKNWEQKKLPEAQRIKLKYAAYASIVADARVAGVSDTSFATRLEKRLRKSGNAVFMGFVRYGARQHDFEKEFEEVYHGDLRAYIVALRKKWPSL